MLYTLDAQMGICIWIRKIWLKMTMANQDGCEMEHNSNMINTLLTTRPATSGLLLSLTPVCHMLLFHTSCWYEERLVQTATT